MTSWRHHSPCVIVVYVIRACTAAMCLQLECAAGVWSCCVQLSHTAGVCSWCEKLLCVDSWNVHMLYVWCWSVGSRCVCMDGCAAAVCVAGVCSCCVFAAGVCTWYLELHDVGGGQWKNNFGNERTKFTFDSKQKRTRRNEGQLKSIRWM